MKKCAVLFLLIYAINLQSQNQLEALSFLNRTDFKVGYYGNFVWNNGINLGLEYGLYEKKIKKERRSGTKIISHHLLLNGSLGFSTNFRSNTENSLHTYYGFIWRRTSSRRWQLNFELNPLGYYRSFLPETFEVKGDEVTEIKFPGRSYYTPSTSIGFGKMRKESGLSAWYLNLNFSLKTNYNAGVLPMVSLQYGYRFNFKKKK
tara:strand:+ start:188585 stop:189196 length:612 start_codon:yes stop_codon:yes gene_type:complete